ncbi:MAG TPA: hypothetical protein VFG87_13545 [Amycolatopsis sp.]|nr:hypothetical protein [Amycolatopsis sp.]
MDVPPFPPTGGRWSRRPGRQSAKTPPETPAYAASSRGSGAEETAAAVNADGASHSAFQTLVCIHWRPDREVTSTVGRRQRGQGWGEESTNIKHTSVR